MEYWNDDEQGWVSWYDLEDWDSQDLNAISKLVVRANSEEPSYGDEDDEHENEHDFSDHDSMPGSSSNLSIYNAALDELLGEASSKKFDPRKSDDAAVRKFILDTAMDNAVVRDGIVCDFNGLAHLTTCLQYPFKEYHPRR